MNTSIEHDDGAKANGAQVRVLGHEAYPVHPWRNGRGVLRHIADGDGWQLRLADITESGPFSDFSGYLRLFAIVDGAVVLQMPDGRQVDCDAGTAVTAFDGGAAPYCKLVSKSASAFNLIVETDKVVASLARLTIGRPHAEAVGESGEFLAIHVQSGQIECRWRSPGAAPGAHGNPILAGAKDTLMPLGKEGVLLQAAAGAATTVVLIARIRPLTGTHP